MNELTIADAARNNAAWCDAVCRAHGTAGEHSSAYWLHRHPTPPRYPNLVTLVASVEPAMSAIRALVRTPPAASWAIKDSFGVLPLKSIGFRILLEAEWIYLPAHLAPAPQRTSALVWSRVDSEPMLAAWENAWGESAGAPRVFVPALLTRSDIAILAACDRTGRITAGVIANRTESAVGLSNFFARGDDDLRMRAGCVGAATTAFPGLPLVGYENGRDLAESRALGFKALGALRVWVRET